eukprot:5496534-Lingulodinium_polyedra.AAC.1
MSLEGAPTRGVNSTRVLCPFAPGDMPSDAVQDARREPGAGPVGGGLPTLHRESSEHTPYCRVDGPSID